MIERAAAAEGAGEVAWRQTAVCRTESDEEADDVPPGVPQLGRRWYEKQATQAMEIEHRDEHTRDEGRLRAMVTELGKPSEGLEGIMLYALVERRPGRDGGGAASGTQSQTQRGESEAAGDEPLHGADGGEQAERRTGRGDGGAASGESGAPSQAQQGGSEAEEGEPMTSVGNGGQGAGDTRQPRRGAASRRNARWKSAAGGGEAEADGRRN